MPIDGAIDEHRRDDGLNFRAYVTPPSRTFSTLGRLITDQLQRLFMPEMTSEDISRRLLVRHME